ICNYRDYSYDVEKDGYTEAEAVDGLLLAVKGNPILRDDVFDRWDLYDLSMSCEMRNAGKKVVVPVQKMPWCLHDDGGVLSMLSYNKYRKRAMRMYGRPPKTIVMTGGYVTLDDFAYALAEGSDAVIVNTREPESTLGPILDDINEDTTVITFNNLGAGFALWKQRNVQFFNILVDHPAHYLEAVSSDYYPGYHALCIDRGHVEFLRSVFKNVPSAFSFMPHGGTDINGMNRDKDIDILYAGGYKNDEEINFAPLPFLDSEEFYDFAISYYDRENYIEAQYVVQEYCQQTGNDYSVEQKAIMTNYIARSVEYYFEAERRKGIIEYLAQRGFSVCLCGNEPWRDIAERYPGNVSYEGMLSPRECIEYISRTKVLINDLPYFAEGAHERVFNGMLNGAVVLSNPSRYLEERFTDKDSILYWDGRDYETVAAKIRQVLDDDGYRISIIQKARSLVENDTWQDRLRSILDL
ncbi:MAG: glycosyltransferase, partial [Lachnospiraceae bacterium]|nr:glycosyltransferase [Lachnospiraceae bacterium]